MSNAKGRAAKNAPLAREIKTILDRYQEGFGEAQRQAYNRMMATLTGDKPAAAAKSASRHTAGRKPG